MRQRDVEALLLYLEQRGPIPHCWGRRANDCVSFIAGAVKAQTGRTHLGRLTWSNRTGALRMLALEGGMEAALDRRFERIAPAQAPRGDIGGVPAVLLIGDAKGSAFAMGAVEAALLGLHPMLIEGETLCAPGPYGLQRLPRAMMTVAWSIMDKPR